MKKVIICLVLITSLFLIRCSPKEIQREIEEKPTHPIVPETTEPPKKEPKTPRAILLSEDEISKPEPPISPPTIEYTYAKIALKIAKAQYEEALNDLDKFIATQTTLQVYTVEAHLLRLILLAAFRAAYLHLGNAYYIGWGNVGKFPEKTISIDERINRLTNLSATSLSYYQKHKAMAVAFLRAYEQLKEIYPLIEKNRLQIVAYPFKENDFVRNTLLDQIKNGAWLETKDRIQAEQIEINNCVLIFWASLMGIGSPSQGHINKFLRQGPYPLDECGIFYWLAKSLNYRTELLQKESYMDEQELVHILDNKALEAQNKSNVLIKARKIAFNPENYNPLRFLPKE